MPGVRDLDIRRELLEFLETAYAPERADTLILDELGVCEGDARVDVAVVNGVLAGYEIKSERDTLVRLERQSKAYARVFDEVTIVASTRHLDRVEELVPAWWGLLAATGAPGNVELEILRPATRNPASDPFFVAQLLWRDEALELLERHGGAAGLRSKPRRHLWKALADRLDASTLGDAVRAQLRAREWRPDARPPRDGGSSRSGSTSRRSPARRPAAPPA